MLRRWSSSLLNWDTDSSWTLSIHPGPGRVLSNPIAVLTVSGTTCLNTCLCREAATEVGGECHSLRWCWMCSPIRRKHPRVKRCRKVALRPGITGVLLLYLLSCLINSNFREKLRGRVHDTVSLVFLPFLSMKIIAAFSGLVLVFLLLILNLSESRERVSSLQIGSL